MPIVFVIGKDWTLRAGVRAELREMGVEALGMESVDDAARAIAGGIAPSAVVLEATTGDAASPAMSLLAKRVPLLVVASRTEPTTAIEGAAAVLYRPVRVGEVVARVQRLLQGHAA